MVVAYLMRYRSYTFRQAMEYVRRQRPIVEPNRGFQRQLEEYQEMLEKEKQGLQFCGLISDGGEFCSAA